MLRTIASIDVIIVNFNGENHIRSCLKSLQKQTFRDFQVIFIDNGSCDQSLKLIRQALNQNQIDHKILIVPLHDNTGFAGGNQHGLKHSNSKYIATLNIDTEVNDNWLEEMFKQIEVDQSVGICASKLVVYNIDRIDSAGDTYTTLLKGDKRGEGQHPKDFHRTEYVFGACAGAALYRREMLDQIGFFDEDFFLIHEDTDLNFRAQLAGWKVLYVPTAIVHHKVRSSIGNMSDMAVYYTLRNSELVRIKNVPFGIFMRCVPEFILGVISEFLYFAIKHKRYRLYLKAKRDALKMFPCMWQKRKITMRTRKVSNAYLLSLMTPIWQKDFFKTKLGKFLHG